MLSSPSNIVINGIGNHSKRLQNMGSVELIIKPVAGDSVVSFNATILPKICDKLPSNKVEPKSWTFLNNLELADPEYYKPGEIDVLLGADMFSRVLLDDHVQGRNGGPDALRTIFGYVLIGKVENVSSNPVQSLFCETQHVDELNKSMNDFFQLESVPDFKLSSDTDICESIFRENFYRTNEGRYVVPLPFRDAAPLFPQSRDLAVQRFLSLERRLLRNSNLYRESLDLSHMEIVKPAQGETNFYLPHHAVVRPDKPSTQVRVVFNVSARMPNNLTLNGCLYVGPKLQSDIGTVLINFRLRKVCFTADVRQMYRQILVAPEFRDYQRLIFRFSPSDDLIDLRLKTVTFGFNCAPFLALRI